MGRVMKISIVGGGPAGLYFAILRKRAAPGSDITVFERNKPDDTFGFGVVFSDQTLDNFERYDPASYKSITDHFAYWDDISIRHRGTEHRVGGNGFCGCSRRTLLMILQDRARDLGVNLVFGVDAATDERLLGSDLIVAADGINSQIREANREHFRPSVDLRPNRFVWMGSTKPLDAFTFIFKETAYGIVIAHAYQYEPDRSTWIFEMTAESFARSDLDGLSEAETAAAMQAVFANELDGHPLLTNRSVWRQFPMIRNERWVKDNIVLLGDAKATAHFSIGSGTKLAMEDAIHLFEALQHHVEVGPALKSFEEDRKLEVEKTQYAADVSLVWFEHVNRFADMDPTQFAFGLMTRSKAITYDNLRLRAPDFVASVDKMFARDVAGRGIGGHNAKPVPPMFQPFKLREMVIKNRTVLSPMCMYSAVDGVPGDWHLMHYGSRAVGGAGLIFTEMTCVAADARITPGCAGLYSDEHEAAWRRIVGFVHAHSDAKICLQLGHAGRKGATRLMWDGMDRPLAEGAWPLVSASPIAYFDESQTPREATRADMDRIRDEFVSAVRRGVAIGFDMVEMHAAHGYLLASFLSPLTNRRTDRYGGSLENRLRFPLEVFEAMRRAWPAEKPMSVRISATDWAEGGITGEASVAIAEAFRDAGCDLIDVSTGQTVRWSKPVYGRMFQTSFSDQIRNEAEIATMCVGNITSADQVNTILAAGRADLVALGRPHLADPSFTLRSAGWYGFEEIAAPKQYAPGKDQLMRNAAKEREDWIEMKRKSKPRTRAGL